MRKNGAYENLLAHGVKPSMQRIAVMQYLMDHLTHPNAEEIYHALLSEMPTLSKTTVYNTLKLLVEQGAARMLTIDERNVCFDSRVQPHGHFLCQRCGRVLDIPAGSVLEEGRRHVPAGFAIDTADLYYRGTCGQCLAGKSQSDFIHT